jgi:hypothetical protein
MDSADIIQKVRQIANLEGIPEVKLNLLGADKFLKENGTHEHYELGLHYNCEGNDPVTGEKTGLEALTIQVRELPSQCPSCISIARMSGQEGRALSLMDGEALENYDNCSHAENIDTAYTEDVRQMHENKSRDLNPAFLVYDRTENLA